MTWEVAPDAASPLSSGKSMRAKPVYRSGIFTPISIGNYGFGLGYQPFERVLYKAAGFLIRDIQESARSHEFSAAVLIGVGEPGQHTDLTLPLHYDEKLEIDHFWTRRYSRTAIGIRIGVEDGTAFQFLERRASTKGRHHLDISILIIPK